MLASPSTLFTHSLFMSLLYNTVYSLLVPRVVSRSITEHILWCKAMRAWVDVNTDKMWTGNLMISEYFLRITLKRRSSHREESRNRPILRNSGSVRDRGSRERISRFTWFTWGLTLREPTLLVPLLKFFSVPCTYISSDKTSTWCYSSKWLIWLPF